MIISYMCKPKPNRDTQNTGFLVLDTCFFLKHWKGLKEKRKTVLCLVVWLYISISQSGILCSNEHALALLKETGLFEVNVNQEMNFWWLAVWWRYAPGDITHEFNQVIWCKSKVFGAKWGILWMLILIVTIQILEHPKQKTFKCNPTLG